MYCKYLVNVPQRNASFTGSCITSDLQQSSLSAALTRPLLEHSEVSIVCLAAKISLLFAENTLCVDFLSLLIDSGCILKVCVIPLTLGCRQRGKERSSLKCERSSWSLHLYDFLLWFQCQLHSWRQTGRICFKADITFILNKTSLFKKRDLEGNFCNN